MDDRESARIEARLKVILDKLEDVLGVIQDGDIDDEERIRRIFYITDRIVRKYKYKERLFNN
jgi:hypothetical protein